MVTVRIPSSCLCLSDRGRVDPVVADALTASLNPDPSTRTAAEARLDQLMQNGETGVALATLLTSSQYDLDLRQIRTILQRKFVLEHWSPFFGNFKGGAPTPEIKDRIRGLLFSGLSDPARKIRTSAGFALSTTAQSDWPDDCPNLLKSLIELLSGASPDSVDGAMRVFAEFIKSEISEEQLLPILRELLPVLMVILGSPEKHSALTRSRVLSVFNQCVQVLWMVKDQYPDPVKEAIDGILPEWLNALKILLDLDPTQDLASGDNWDGVALRIQIFKAVERITYCFPRAISQVLRVFYDSAIFHMEKLLPAHQTYYVTADGPSPLGSSDDSGETTLLPQLGRAILDFVKSATRTKAMKEWVLADEKEGASQVIAPLLSLAIAWAQMTAEDEVEWASDPNAFLADDIDEESATLRNLAFDLVISIEEIATEGAAMALQAVLQRIVQDSNNARLGGNPGWWKLMEAGLAAAGSLEEDEFDAKPFLVDVIPPLLNLGGDLPFIQGRGFVFASQFSDQLPANLFSQYLQAVVAALESPSVSMPVKVSAVKAMQNFAGKSDAKDVIVPLAARICNDLTPFLLSATEDALTLVTEALLAMIELGDSEWLTPELTTPLVTSLMEVWIKNVKDPILLSVLTDVFVAIARCPVPGVYQAIVTIALPSLASAITQATQDQSWIVTSAIDLATSLMRGAPKGQLGDGFFNLLGPALFTCLLNTEDREVIQNGIECLTLVIRKGCDQLLAFVMPQTGESGLTLLLRLVSSLLTPATSESEAGGLFVGDMLVHLLKNAGKAPELQPVIPDLITALSLIVPVAYLIHTQRDDVLNLLDSLTVGSTTGLTVFANAWCENAEIIQGAWATKLSAVALCDIFLSDRASLASLRVKGDMIIRPETSNVIMTRSRTKQIPTEYEMIPFHVKVLKLLVSELQQSGESALLAAQGKAAKVDKDLDQAADWEEEEDLFQGLKQEELGFLSDFIDAAAGEDDHSPAQGDDEDLQDDPVSQLDLRTHLLGFFRQCAQANPQGFSQLVDGLKVEETLIVQKAVSG
ncbi:polysaccharide lyase family 8 protein [Tulasnella calospora MUT 4182]|uniref:Polysaccharide lyase family 8 protein n=1 Tax=Tulasnella calospora MUT 4182 TaxID=1051891 RepID=A0A0C3QS75_9AGAM|nr:polysaccharide lyase family 8 protein [Tulasnella calospora MUT 4182]